MSDTKLENYLTRVVLPDTYCPVGTPVLLAASKGFDLKDTADKTCTLKFWCKRGANIQEEIRWLRINLGERVKWYNKILLMIWLGTCDITIKKGKYIKLRDTSVERATNNIICQLRDLLQEVLRFPTITPVFLENPVYSISKYNQSKGHPHPESFNDQDNILCEQIESLNLKIRQLNIELGHRETVSPRFSLDVEQRRKGP